MDEILTRWAKVTPKPIVLLIDEIDACPSEIVPFMDCSLSTSPDDRSMRPIHYPQVMTSFDGCDGGVSNAGSDILEH